MMDFVEIFTPRTDARAFTRAEGYWESPSGCWLWAGPTTDKGYGLIRPVGRMAQAAHRYLYERFVGPVPIGLVLDHFKCDTPACCNPWHVRPATSRENTLRSDKTFAARQLAQTHCLRGHPLSGANLRPAKSEPGKRRCKTCKNAAARLAYAERRTWGP